MYWDADGNLRYGNSTRQRDDELIQVLQADTNDDSDESRLWMIVPSRWLRLWLQFASLKLGDPPSEIDMKSLLVRDTAVPDGWRPKNTLKPAFLKNTNTLEEVEDPGHYRRVSLQVWLKLLELYGTNGGALAVRGAPFDDMSRWGYFPNPKVIDINKLQPPVIKEEKKKKEDEKKKDVVESGGGILGGLFGGSK